MQICTICVYCMYLYLYTRISSCLVCSILCTSYLLHRSFYYIYYIVSCCDTCSVLLSLTALLLLMISIIACLFRDNLSCHLHYTQYTFIYYNLSTLFLLCANLLVYKYCTDQCYFVFILKDCCVTEKCCVVTQQLLMYSALCLCFSLTVSSISLSAFCQGRGIKLT